MADKTPSAWQQKIAGEWHGIPSNFDAQGNHLGFDKVYRSSVFDEASGTTTYYMNTNFHAMPAVHIARLYTPDPFKFGVIDSDQDRIYTGPDFYGEGQPFGGLVDSHYYSPFWNADLRTMNLVLPDGKTQVYSSQLYEGPVLQYVFNGIYRVAFDYASNPETKAEIDAFCESERVNGMKPHALSSKQSGVWRGELDVFGPDQKHAGVVSVTMLYTPTSLTVAEQTVEMRGAFDKRFAFNRTRQGNRHTFSGDIFGNGFAFGRALFTTQHFVNEALKIRGREFLIDDRYTLCNVWQIYKSGKLLLNVFGVLKWESF